MKRAWLLQACFSFVRLQVLGAKTTQQQTKHKRAFTPLAAPRLHRRMPGRRLYACTAGREVSLMPAHISTWYKRTAQQCNESYTAALDTLYTHVSYHNAAPLAYSTFNGLNLVMQVSGFCTKVSFPPLPVHKRPRAARRRRRIRVSWSFV